MHTATKPKSGVSRATEPLSIRFYPDGRLDTKNAALYLGVAEKTLAMWRVYGTGPPFVKRGRVFYYKDDLDEWLQAGRVTSTAQLKASADKGE